MSNTRTFEQYIPHYAKFADRIVEVDEYWKILSLWIGNVHLGRVANRRQALSSHDGLPLPGGVWSKIGQSVGLSGQKQSQAE
jgi:hypothetical protein